MMSRQLANMYCRYLVNIVPWVWLESRQHSHPTSVLPPCQRFSIPVSPPMRSVGFTHLWLTDKTDSPNQPGKRGPVECSETSRGLKSKSSQTEAGHSQPDIFSQSISLSHSWQTNVAFLINCTQIKALKPTALRWIKSTVWAAGHLLNHQHKASKGLWVWRHGRMLH